jgi:hypothetical protein
LGTVVTFFSRAIEDTIAAERANFAIWGTTAVGSDVLVEAIVTLFTCFDNTIAACRNPADLAAQAAAVAAIVDSIIALFVFSLNNPVTAVRAKLAHGAARVVGANVSDTVIALLRTVQDFVTTVSRLLATRSTSAIATIIDCVIAGFAQRFLNDAISTAGGLQLATSRTCGARRTI